MNKFSEYTIRRRHFSNNYQYFPLIHCTNIQFSSLYNKKFVKACTINVHRNAKERKDDFWHYKCMNPCCICCLARAFIDIQEEYIFYSGRPPISPFLSDFQRKWFPLETLHLAIHGRININVQCDQRNMLGNIRNRRHHIVTISKTTFIFF